MKAGVEIELVNFKGGSQTLTAVIGGSADVVSGYYDHCVNLAAKNRNLQAFVVYNRYSGLVLGVSPKRTNEINAVKDLAGKKIGVSAPDSSTDFFLKYLLAKNGVSPDSVAVIGIGLDADERQAGIHLEGRDQRRDAPRQHHLGQDLPLAGAEGLRQLHLVGIDAPEAAIDHQNGTDVRDNGCSPSTESGITSPTKRAGPLDLHCSLSQNL